MPLQDVPLPMKLLPLPDAVAALLRAADERIERFQHDHRDDPIAAFVPSDFVAVYAAVQYVSDSGLASGSAFCEWGSGFGVVTILAAMCHFDACGIEIEPLLVDEAQQLAEEHDSSAHFVAGSFVPVGGEHFTDDVGEFSWLSLGGPDGHEELGLDPEDFDVIFAYPWPGEEHVVERLFEKYAAAGALLLTYRGKEQMRLHRKVN